MVFSFWRFFAEIVEGSEELQAAVRYDTASVSRSIALGGEFLAVN